MNRQQLEKRVIDIASAVLNKQHYVSSIDVLLGIGYLQVNHLEDWRRRKAPYLEKVIHANLNKITRAMQCFHNWARNTGLKPSETDYVAKTRGPKQALQFSKSGNFKIELAYRTHYLSPQLSEKKCQKLKEKLEKPAEQVVFWIINESQCVKCKKDLHQGSFLLLENDDPFCMKCAGLGDLVFLPSGDAKLTRHAKKYSATYAVVVKFSRARKRYERQGLLVQEDALEKAKANI